MKHLILFSLLIATLIGCKKDEPKPEPTPPPAPITEATVKFIYVNRFGGEAKITIGSMDSTLVSNGQGDTARATFVSHERMVSVFTSFYDRLIVNSSTLTVNSGHKSYTYVDTEGKPHLVYLW